MAFEGRGIGWECSSASSDLFCDDHIRITCVEVYKEWNAIHVVHDDYK